MATIRKRGSRYQAIIRLSNRPAEYRTFDTLKEAKTWAESRNSVSISDVLDWWDKHVVAYHTDRKLMRVNLRQLQRDSIATVIADDLIPAHLRDYWHRRQPKARSAELELLRLKQALTAYHHEVTAMAGLQAFTRFKIPNAIRPRTRRLSLADRASFLSAIGGSGNAKSPVLAALVECAMLTGMRKAELLALTWDDVMFDQHLLMIRKGKGDKARVVPMVQRTEEILQSLERTSDKVFDVSIATITREWRRACDKTGITDFRFHDLRHLALTDWSELGLTAAEIMPISGHTTLAALQTYLNHDSKRISDKLRQLYE